MTLPFVNKLLMVSPRNQAINQKLLQRAEIGLYCRVDFCDGQCCASAIYYTYLSRKAYAPSSQLTGAPHRVARTETGEWDELWLWDGSWQQNQQQNRSAEIRRVCGLQQLRMRKKRQLFNGFARHVHGFVYSLSERAANAIRFRRTHADGWLMDGRWKMMMAYCRVRMRAASWAGMDR